MTELDIEAIAAEHLKQCGPCDYGLPMACQCPTGDPRSAISRLIDEVKRLRAETPGGETREVFTVRTRGVIWPGYDNEAAAWRQFAAVKAWPEKTRARIDKQTITEWPDGRCHRSPYEYVGGDFVLDGAP